MSISIYSQNVATEDYQDTGINVSNSNFSAIMNALGLDSQQGCGQLPLVEFKEALQRYLSSDIKEYVDGGLRPVKEKGTGATFIFCGRREGYITEKVQRLLVAIQIAESNGKDLIYWG